MQAVRHAIRSIAVSVFFTRAGDDLFNGLLELLTLEQENYDGLVSQRIGRGAGRLLG